MNVGGESLASGAYKPAGWATINGALSLYGGDEYDEALYVVLSGVTSPYVMQHSCIPGSLVHFCANGIDDTCGFGGCEINDLGTILALDSSNGKLMTYTYGSTSSAKDLPIVPAKSNASFINNFDQVASSALFSSDTLTGTQAIVYSIGTGKTTPIPFLPASSPGSSDYCEPMSLNNAGAVLGICTDTDNVVNYWTWDTKNSLRLLASEIPVSSAYAEIVPLAMNDNGQILVELVTPTLSVHWGILNPTSNTVPTIRKRR